MNLRSSIPSLVFAASTMLASLNGGEYSDLPRKVTNETSAEKDARMAWWTDARFGMFIHFGLYAVAAGVGEDELWGTHPARCP